MSDLSLLMDMGFPQPKAEKALVVTGNKGVEPAMEWLLAHANDAEQIPVDTSTEEKSEAIGSSDLADVQTEKTEGEEAVSEALSIQCDECNKKFRTDSEVEFHAVKTGHQKFSESSDEFKPLSEEEKQERVKKLEVIIKQRRAEKAEQDRKEALEKEKTRRKAGQEITHLRQKMQEDEIKQLAELKRLEKQEAKMARQRVLEQIERDKQARREKFNMGPPTAAPSAPVVQKPIAPAACNQTYDECRIQIRLTNGECLINKFNPKEELAAVRLYIEMHRTDGSGPFALMTNFPKKIFTEEDMNVSLSSLGLVPSAVIIVCKPVIN